ncbi:unnamed protein product [Linum tenue]|uniref:Glycosyltransferase n=1 Tax=Linum tenue TaxID=586396 RepID=A0AAV0QCX8_9ROSI|nr:unnamed protein product [Linum tenue]
MVELAKLLVHRHSTLVISLVIITSPSTATAAVTRYADSLAAAATPRVSLLRLRGEDDPSLPAGNAAVSMIESQRTRVREALLEFTPTARLAGFVLDMFCTSMLDVAEELGVPSYLFFPSGAAFLGFTFHIQTLHDEESHDEEGFDVTELKEAELACPGLTRPVPSKVIPSGFLNKEWVALVYTITRNFRKTKGILVNTVRELESYALESLSRGKNIPKVYPVGPILNLKGEKSRREDDETIEWLDQQPESSVVFLCFGSMGAFRGEQVREIASALEGSGHRFLWSLRRPGEGGPWASPTDYEDVREVLPEGFLDRTAEVGRVMGWVPQAAVLAHKSIGGFVSHCGWNSTLESVWFGVPMATWPMYAEQQFNAFLLVEELEIATEVRMDYRSESEEVVSAEELERGIRSLMEDCSRKGRMKGFSDLVRGALTDGGSSSSSIAEFIGDVSNNDL